MKQVETHHTSDSIAVPSPALGWADLMTSPWQRLRLELIVRTLKRHTPSVGHWLDYGCGDGSLLGRALAEGWSVVGIDRDPEMTQLASNRLSSLSKPERWVVHTGDLMSRPFADYRYEVVSAHNVLEYVEDRSSLVSQLGSTLTSSGVLSVVYANPAAVPITVAVRTSDPNKTMAALKRGRLRIGMPGESKEAAPIDEATLIATLADQGLALEGRYGVRIFNDLMTAEDVKSDPDWLAAALELELTACAVEPYRSIARHTHLVFRRTE